MEIPPFFRDRADAGRKLAECIDRSRVERNALVLALPRGGVPVGYEVAKALQVELDVFLVRKLGLPSQEELAIGAIASGGVRVLNEELIAELRVPADLVDRIAAREEREMERREKRYRGNRPRLPVRDRTVILVDDGLATGATMKAATRALHVDRPSRVIVAVPVAAKETCHELRSEVDEIICAFTPWPFQAVGNWYEDFSQTTDEEVRRLLCSGRAGR